MASVGAGDGAAAPTPVAPSSPVGRRSKRKADGAPAGLPSRRVRAASPSEEEQMAALFGSDEEDYELDDPSARGSVAENKGLAAALRSRYKKVAGSGSAGGVSARGSAQPPPVAPKTLNPLSALFGFTQGIGGVGDADVTEFIDALPPSQLLVRGSLLCPHLQSANSLVTMMREKCLAPTPSFSSPQELSANVDRIVMLLMSSASRLAREMGLAMSNEARNLFGSGRFKSMTRGDMVKLQRRVNMLILEDPDTAADSFTALMRRSKLDKAFDKAWECQVDNDYLLGDDTPLQPELASSGGGSSSQQSGGGGGQSAAERKKAKDKAARAAKALCYKCGLVGHMKHTCPNAPNEERVATEKAKRASLRDK